VQPGRISGLDIFVDPIKSEIQVLRSVEQLRRLGLRVFGAVLNEVATTTTEESYYTPVLLHVSARGRRGGGMG
jgi:hypothetical protein